jgi:hypothetical protein
MSDGGWVGIDLDGTLAHYDGWHGIEHIGEPVPSMLELTKNLLAAGHDVRIFTARVSEGSEAIGPIEAWCQEHLGKVLPVTNVKDFAMILLIDDRCVSIVKNEGRIATQEEGMAGLEAL